MAFSINPVDSYANWQNRNQSGNQQPGSKRKRRETNAAEPVAGDSEEEPAKQETPESSPVGQRIDVEV